MTPAERAELQRLADLWVCAHVVAANDSTEKRQRGHYASSARAGGQRDALAACVNELEELLDRLAKEDRCEST